MQLVYAAASDTCHLTVTFDQYTWGTPVSSATATPPERPRRAAYVRPQGFVKIEPHQYSRIAAKLIDRWVRTHTTEKQVREQMRNTYLEISRNFRAAARYARMLIIGQHSINNQTRLRQHAENGYNYAFSSVWNKTTVAKCPSFRDTLAELVALDRNYGGLEVDWFNGLFRVHTTPITLTHDGDTVEFGQFTIVFNFARVTSGIMVSAYPLVPKYARGTTNVTHPHVKGGYICRGSCERSTDKAWDELRLLDLADDINALLHTYNPLGPFKPLEAWVEIDRTLIRCNGCQVPTNDDNQTVCYACNGVACNECRSECAECVRLMCRNCEVTCDDCDNSVCSTHGHSVRSDQFNVLCTECSRLCEHCDCWVHNDDWDGDAGMCSFCVEELDNREEEDTHPDDAWSDDPDPDEENEENEENEEEEEEDDEEFAEDNLGDLRSILGLSPTIFDSSQEPPIVTQETETSNAAPTSQSEFNEALAGLLNAGTLTADEVVVLAEEAARTGSYNLPAGLA